MFFPAALSFFTSDLFATGAWAWSFTRSRRFFHSCLCLCGARDCGPCRVIGGSCLVRVPLFKTTFPLMCLTALDPCVVHVVRVVSSAMMSTLFVTWVFA